MLICNLIFWKIFYYFLALSFFKCLYLGSSSLLEISAATPKPAIAATFSVPEWSPISYPPPMICGTKWYLAFPIRALHPSGPPIFERKLWQNLDLDIPNLQQFFQTLGRSHYGQVLQNYELFCGLINVLNYPSFVVSKYYRN